MRFCSISFVRLGSLGQPIFRKIGLILFSRGILAPIAVVGQRVPGSEKAVFDSLGTASVNNNGTIVFSASLAKDEPNDFGWFVFSNGIISRVFPFYLLQEEVDFSLLSRYPAPISNNDSDAIGVRGQILGRGTGLFVATPQQFPVHRWRGKR